MAASDAAACGCAHRRAEAVVDEISQTLDSAWHRMTRPDPAETVVVEVSRRGKLVVGEPFFTAGTPLLLDRKSLATPARAISSSRAAPAAAPASSVRSGP